MWDVRVCGVNIGAQFLGRFMLICRPETGML